MAPPVIYDALRLFLGAGTPRGIDRVDVCYARHLFHTWPGECHGLLPTPWGLRLYDRSWVLDRLGRLEALWHEQRGSGDDPVLAQVLRQLDGRDAAPGRGSRGTPAAIKPWKLRATGMALGLPAGRAAPPDSLYLNIGQLGWAAPWTARWLHQRPDVRPVFMLHDVIPIEHPHLVSRLGHLTHKRMVDTAARHAAGLIATTATAGESVLAALHARGRPAPPVVALPLPVAPVFLQPEPPDPGLAAHTYFLLCGAIEPRKNHLMLLRVWEELARRLGERTPRLIVAGAPARGGKPILQRLEGCSALRRYLIIATGLSSPALRRLMAQARAVLMPSLAEGFGLPIIEALTLGTPVLASNLPAHLEVGGDFAIYLDPGDVAGWVCEIDRLVKDRAYAEGLRRRTAAYQPTTAATYFPEIERFLERLGCDHPSNRGAQRPAQIVPAGRVTA